MLNSWMTARFEKAGQAAENWMAAEAFSISRVLIEDTYLLPTVPYDRNPLKALKLTALIERDENVLWRPRLHGQCKATEP